MYLRTSELARGQAELARSTVEIENSQVGLARFHAQNEISAPPQEKIPSLEKVMAEWTKSNDELMQEKKAIP